MEHNELVRRVIGDIERFYSSGFPSGVNIICSKERICDDVIDELGASSSDSRFGKDVHGGRGIVLGKFISKYNPIYFLGT